MTNAMRAVPIGIKQDTADELVCMQRHPLLAAACSEVLPSECDSITVNADETGAEDSDAGGGVAEIVQNLSGSCKWQLGADHPVDAIRRFRGSIEGRRMGQPNRCCRRGTANGSDHGSASVA